MRKFTVSRGDIEAVKVKGKEGKEERGRGRRRKRGEDCSSYCLRLSLPLFLPFPRFILLYFFFPHLIFPLFLPFLSTLSFSLFSCNN